MLKILIASEDAQKLDEISRLSAGIGNFQTMSLLEGPARFPFHGSQMQLADLLIIEQTVVGASQMHSIEALREQHPELPCILVTPNPSSDCLIKALRAGVRDVLAWPLDRTQLAEALRRVEASHVPRNRELAQVISFISCKGGAGTSFLASNLGYALGAQLGKRVLVIDLNRQFGDLTYLVSDKPPPSTLPEICSQIERMDAAFLDACLTHVESNFDILAGATDPIKASQIQKEKLEWILSVVQPVYDFVIVDIGQALDPLSIGLLDRSDRICVVVEPTIAFARPGRRLLDILRALHYSADKVHILLNREGRRNALARSALGDVFGMKIFHALPDDSSAVDEAISHGEPVAKSHKRSAIAKAILALGTQFVAATGAERRAQQDSVSPLRKLMLRTRAT
ncbi:AAA family ATPase [Cupriavidus basilensis]|uniref:AAA family ATPase n=1 Tax=Cupriavidus basilensis TaxID=68895 RepID=A0A643FPZ5_9BURK|nr:AAA family ATPase [Cupriavidus basilensis]QOT77293.1 AAA family ATPase [Cupriavidus basilensis]